MKRLGLALAAALLLDSGAEARRWDRGVCLFGLDDVGDPLRFEDYRIARNAVSRPAPPLLLSAQARRFRTMLRRGAATGPNFAGRYTIVKWGCGASCLDFAIVDARSGEVFLPHDLRALWHGHVDEAEALLFRGDSRLLIVLGAPNEDERREGIAFYEWTGSSLRQLRVAPARQLCGQP